MHENVHFGSQRISAALKFHHLKNHQTCMSVSETHQNRSEGFEDDPNRILSIDRELHRGPLQQKTRDVTVLFAVNTCLRCKHGFQTRSKGTGNSSTSTSTSRTSAMRYL
jgi:hypothetical protein